MSQLLVLICTPLAATVAPAPSYAEVLQNTLIGFQFLFTTIVISGINILVSGHILGFVLGLGIDGNNHFTIKIPLLLHMQVRGDRVVAGFAAFAVSLLVVGIYMPTVAKLVFIENLQATNEQWTACQGLAAIMGVVGCILLAFVKQLKFSVSTVLSDAQLRPESPEERARKLTSAPPVSSKAVTAGEASQKTNGSSVPHDPPSGEEVRK